jgi:hypothetical protein
VSGSPDAIRKLRAALGAGAIPDLYVTGGRPVRIERVSGTLAVDLDLDLDCDAPLPVAATPVTPALLALLLAEHTWTYTLRSRKDDKGRDQITEAETTPPPTVLSAVLAGAEWPTVPTLAGIIGTPVLRRDWSLLQAPGYDPASGLYLAPTVTLPPVPDTPTPAQVTKARRFVLETLLGDFEWEDTASLANYVALMVTPFLRRPLRALAPSPSCPPPRHRQARACYRRWSGWVPRRRHSGHGRRQPGARPGPRTHRRPGQRLARPGTGWLVRAADDADQD